MRKSFKKALSFVLSAAMIAGLGSGAATADAASVSADKVASYTARPYRAYLAFQSDVYSFRDSFDSDTYGILSTKEQQKEFASGTGSVYASADAQSPGISGFDWTKMFFYRVAKGTETTEKEFRDYNADGTKDKYTVPKSMKCIVGTADFESPDISYDGTYTVSMKNFPADTFQYDKGFRMLYADTTIPLTEANVKFTNVSLKIDGTQVYTAAEGVIRNNVDSPNTYKLMVANEYGYSDYGCKGEKANSKNDAVPDMVWEAGKTNGGVVNMPKNSIEITFTVSGLGAAPAGYVPQDNNSSVASGTTITVATPPACLAKGATFTAGKFNYKVTKTSEKSGSATVALTGVKSSAQNKASLSVPASVTNEDFKYKVTAINSKAFAKCKKLKTVTIGSNVKTIEKNAFANCKKLNALKIKGKLSKVAKGAFKGCKQKIKVSGKAKAANVKALKKSGYKKFK